MGLGEMTCLQTFPRNSRAFGLLRQPSSALSAHRRPNIVHVLTSAGIAFYPEGR